MQLEALYETWLRFKKKLITISNHGLSKNSLLEIFYGDLNENIRVIVDTIIGGTFMSLCWKLAIEILDWVSNTNREWHTREA